MFQSIIKSVFGSIKCRTMQPNEYQKPSKETLLKTLTPEQYYVTQESGTEKPFKSNNVLNTDKYNNVFTPGTYKCVVCGINLFSSEHKFETHCGWPAFFDSLKDSNIVRIRDGSHGMDRVEVRCGRCDAHLGHVFDDGPQDKTGERYCINSASLNLDEKKEGTNNTKM